MIKKITTLLLVFCGLFGGMLRVFADDEVPTFTVDPDGTGRITYVDKRQTPTIEFQLFKVNPTGSKLAGAKFGIYSDAECNTLVEDKTTNSDGMFKYDTKFVVGTDYYIREIKAPTGYVKDTKAYHFKVTKSTEDELEFTFDGHDYTLSTGASPIAIVNNVTTDNSYTVQYTNTNRSGERLPVTGSNGVILFMGAGLLLIAGAVFMKKKK